MSTYQIRINERTALGKSIMALLQSIPQVITFEREKPKNELYHSLDSAFRDVKLMMDGKKREKTIEEFLDEL